MRAIAFTRTALFPYRDRVNSGSLFGPEIAAAGPIVDDPPTAFPYRLRVRNACESRG